MRRIASVSVFCGGLLSGPAGAQQVDIAGSQSRFNDRVEALLKRGFSGTLDYEALGTHFGWGKGVYNPPQVGLSDLSPGAGWEMHAPPVQIEPQFPSDPFGLDSFHRSIDTEQPTGGSADIGQLRVIAKNSDQWARLSPSAPNRIQSPTTAVATESVPTAKYFGSGNTFTVPMGKSVVPGGISLSLAAAMRMRLNMTIEGVRYNDGRILIAGQSDSTTSIDAALFLTGLRLACADGDPYFSLDPDNGKAWLDEGQQAAKEMWDQLSDKARPNDQIAQCVRRRAVKEPLSIKTFSARRDYLGIWVNLQPKFPDLQSRLVFRPEWLAQTRFGQILYKADVLLKELAGGIQTIDNSVDLRANKIGGYESADARKVGRDLLDSVERNSATSKVPKWEGNRLWFDLVGADSRDCGGIVCQPVVLDAVTIPNAKKAASRPATALRAYLASRGQFRDSPSSRLKASLTSYENSVDLSALYPMMFVRRHDQATGQDIPGQDVDLDALSADINGRTAQYAKAYQELADLTEIFRTYVAAVKLSQLDRGVCNTVAKLPRLFPSEQVSSPLPSHHPTELFLTIGSYTFADGRMCNTRLASVESNNGGISLRGKVLYEAPIIQETPLIQELIAETSSKPKERLWKNGSGRQYLQLLVDESLPNKISEDLVRPTAPVDPEFVIQAQDKALAAADDEQHKSDEAAQKAEMARQEVKEKEGEARQVAIEKQEFGQPLSRRAVEMLVPYAVAAQDVYSDNTTGIIWRDIKRLMNWDVVLKGAGYSDARIRLFASSGFRAVVYKRDVGGEITIAFGSGLRLEDRANVKSLGVAAADIRMKAAADLAWIVKQAFPNDTITLTGDTEGGRLAEYAGEQTGILRTIAFNTFGLPSFTRTGNPQAISVTVLKNNSADSQ